VSGRLSARNPKVQRLRRLAHHRRDRWDERAFVLEGPHLVRDALEHDHPLDAIYAEPDGELDVGGRNIPVYELEPGTLAKATDTVTPQSVAAIAPMPENDLGVVDRVIDDGGIVVVLAGVNDPGNAGTLLRVAEAAGVGAVLFCDEAVDPFTPKCVRASAGSVMHVPVASGAESVHLLEAVGRRGARRLAAGARRGDPYDRTVLTGPLALVLGSEAHGIPASLEPVLDDWTHVPMAGYVESLNVGATGAVICFEAARQRRGSGPARP
jgi:RNA methyltransferase, TrmH family